MEEQSEFQRIMDQLLAGWLWISIVTLMLSTPLALCYLAWLLFRWLVGW